MSTKNLGPHYFQPRAVGSSISAAEYMSALQTAAAMVPVSYTHLKLVVEVDGFSFHENRPEQLRRDALKDAILTKNNIPFLRLATNGSGEWERIIHALQ